MPSLPRTLTGIAAAPGLAWGPAVLWADAAVEIPRRTGCRPDEERGRLDAAREAARADIRRLREKVATEAGPAEAAIFDAHLMFLDDGALLDLVQTALERGVNAEAAWMDAVEHFASQLQQLPDPTLRARAADVRDVGRRVLDHLVGRRQAAPVLRAPGVVVAPDLAPSQLAALDVALVRAFCTAEGGPTSHTAILARAWGRPAVVGVGPAILQVSNGTLLLVDGSRGQVVVDPDPATVEEFAARAAAADRRRQDDLAAAGEPALTRDGHRVEVAANVGSVEEAAAALGYGAEGIGLVRTEFLYLNRQTPPSEEEQVAAYRAILEAMGTRPVVIRTLDIGGDKPLPYLPMPAETNPFLGWRAIRISLQRPDLFLPQLRALLRAGPGHDLRIMFPLIATPEELRRAMAALAQAADEVRAAGHPMAERVQVGMMVEVPSAVVLADIFAAEVDFFSIGTNDLTQYTLAADRGNERVAALSDAIHPAILRQVRRVVEVGHRAGRWVGVCGELAGDPEAVPILLGLGVDELSMTARAIPAAKAVIRRWSLAAARELAGKALAMDSAEAVRALVRRTPPG